MIFLVSEKLFCIIIHTQSGVKSYVEILNGHLCLCTYNNNNKHFLYDFLCLILFQALDLIHFAFTKPYKVGTIVLISVFQMGLYWGIEK